MTRLTTDVDALNELFTSGFVALLGDVAVLAGIVAVLFALDTTLAAITFAILLPMLWVTNWFRKGARDTYRDVRVKIARVNAFLQEHISGMSVVQLFRHEPVSRRSFAEVNDAHRQANLDSIFYYSVFYPALDFLSAVGMASIVWYGGGEVLRGRMTLGAVVAFLQYSKRFYRPLMDLSEKYNILQAAMASSERIFQLLDARAVDHRAGRSGRPEGAASRRRRVRGRALLLQEGRGDPEGRLVPRAARPHGRARGRDGRGQVHGPEPPPALLRRDGGPRPRGRHGRAPVRPRAPARALRHRPAGHVPLHRARSRRTSPSSIPTCRARASRRPAVEVGLGAAPRAHPGRPRREALRARRRPLRRREAARLLRARARARPAHPHPRRGHVLRRSRDREDDRARRRPASSRAARRSSSRIASRRSCAPTRSSSSRTAR